MEKAILEDIAQRLDRLEKMMTEVNEQLSWLVEKLNSDVPKDCEHTEAARVLGRESNKQDAHRAKIVHKIFKKMGISGEPIPAEELQARMAQHGIRAEDNEFSRAIIAERER